MSRLQKELARIHKRIETYQNKCKHKNVLIKECGDTGNWCPDDDRYWTEYRCQDCLKFWSVDKKKETWL